MDFDELNGQELSYTITEVEEGTRTTIYVRDEEARFYQVNWSEPSKYPDGEEYEVDTEVIENDIQLMLEHFGFEEETSDHDRLKGPMFGNEEKSGTTILISGSESQFKYETDQLINDLDQPIPEIFHRYDPERS